MGRYIVLLGHGAFPSDFPKNKISKYLGLRQKFMKKELNNKEKNDFKKLENEILKFKRTKKNDPHFYFHKKLTRVIEKELKIKCFFAFNEFCAPLLEDSIKKIYERDKNAEILIIPTMFTGGIHIQRDIPQKVREIKKKYKVAKINYFPFKEEFISDFFIKHIKSLLK